MQTITAFNDGNIVVGINAGNNPEATGVFSVSDEVAQSITSDSVAEVKKGKLYIDGVKVDADIYIPTETEQAVVKPVELSSEEIARAEKEDKIQAIRNELKDLIIRKEIDAILDEDTTEIVVRIELLKKMYADINAPEPTTTNE